MQIGPRIRVGGTVGKIGEKIKKIVPSPASMIGGAMIPLGNLAGSALNHSIKEDALKGAKNTPFAVAGAKLLGANGSTPGIPGVNSGGSGLPFGLGLGDLVDYGLGGANLYNAAQLGQQSTDYAKKAEGAVTGSYNERAPLRIAGIEGMLHPDAQNAAKLAGVNAIQGPQIAAQPLPLGPTDPRLAMVNRTQGRGNPWSQPPLPLR